MDPQPREPRIWVLAGHRTGDNLQLKALAGALGWPWEERRLTWRSWPPTWTPFYGRRGPSLAPLTPEARQAIRPPWPDLVLSIGWRSVPVARWIGRESGARLVHLGRPRAPLAAFDLVLTTPQYQLPDAPNVVRLSAPLSGLATERLAAEAARWRPRLRHLPRPWIAVLVGGDAPPLRLTGAAAAELGARADALARARGGSLLIATGPRTPPAAAETLLAAVGVPAHSWLWGSKGENPYAAYLALADEIVVTADSISMVHEASLTGRPLHLFDLPVSGRLLARAAFRVDRVARVKGAPIRERYLALIRNGWLAPPKDVAAVRDRLLASGQAAVLGSATPPRPVRAEASDAARAAGAVRRLFGAAGPAQGGRSATPGGL